MSADQVTLDPMRFQARSLPHPVHHIFADAQMGRDFAATAVRGSVGWLSGWCYVDELLLDIGKVVAVRSAGSLKTISVINQSRHS